MSNHSTSPTASRTGHASDPARVATTKPCPFCRQIVGVMALTCDFCHRPVPAPAVRAEAADIATLSVMPYREDETPATRSSGIGVLALIRGLFL